MHDRFSRMILLKFSSLYVSKIILYIGNGSERIVRRWLGKLFQALNAKLAVNVLNYQVSVDWSIYRSTETTASVDWSICRSTETTASVD